MLLAAGDTFRAAAAEQLDAVGRARRLRDRARARPGSDPGAVAFDAIEAAQGARARRGDRGHRRAGSTPSST